MEKWKLFHFADEVALEQDAERKIGWLLKLFFAGTATVIGYQFFPYLGLWGYLFHLLLAYVYQKCILYISYIYIIFNVQDCVLYSVGDNLIQQSVSLLHVKDPLFKRMGASRLARFAIDGNVLFPCIYMRTEVHKKRKMTPLEETKHVS